MRPKVHAKFSNYLYFKQIIKRFLRIKKFMECETDIDSLIVFIGRYNYQLFVNSLSKLGNGSLERFRVIF